MAGKSRSNEPSVTLNKYGNVNGPIRGSAPISDRFAMLCMTAVLLDAPAKHGFIVRVIDSEKNLEHLYLDYYLTRFIDLSGLKSCTLFFIDHNLSERHGKLILIGTSVVANRNKNIFSFFCSCCVFVEEALLR